MGYWRWIAFLCVAACIAPSVVRAGQSTPSIEPQRSDEVPRNSARQNLPCAQQAKSLEALRHAFRSGRTPSPAEVTGSWVAIGFFGDIRNDLNCTGLKRGSKFEEVMLAKGYSLEMHVIGTLDQSPTMKRDGNGGVSFPFDFGGDASPVFNCQLTARHTLACVIDVYRQGVEFKRMAVQQSEIYSAKTW